MRQRRIKAAFIRGGTSKGVFFRAGDTLLSTVALVFFGDERRRNILSSSDILQ